jgi:DNA-binding LacI/PurR family transcriptional regulator
LTGRVTIVDVARACNLAPSTVSNALANKPLVTPDTRRFVVEVAERLGYRASTTARSLRLQRSWTIGLLASDIANSFYAEILSAVEDEAWKRGVSVLLGNTEFDDEKQSRYVRSLLDKNVDGLIMMSHRLLDHDIEQIQRQRVPVVFLNRRDDRLNADYVSVDNVAGAEAAMRHLLEAGHRRIGFIAGRRQLTAAHERESTYRQALIQAGIPVDPTLIAEGDYTQASGHAASQALLKRENPPTAVFCANDLMALGLMAAAVELGFQLPEDLSIVGFDDLDITAHPLISLTTVHTPRRDMGRAAANLLLDRIDRHDRPYQRVWLMPRLIVRRSVTSPNA